MFNLNFAQISIPNTNLVWGRNSKVSSILLFIALFGIFFMSCQKNDLKESIIQKETTANYQQGFVVKDGYLVFRNWRNADSLINQIGKMTQDEVDNWEKMIGFKSARRSMSIAFAEYEKIQNESDLQNFKQKYNSEFIFSSEQNDNGFNFKPGVGFYAQLFSSSGKMIIGNILYDCSGRELKVYLLKNGEVINNLNFNQGNKLKNYIVYADNGPYTICTFPFYFNSSNNRRVRSYLEVFPKLDPAGIDPSPYYYLTFKYYLHQKGQKTIFGIWNDYNSNLNIKNGKIYIESETYSKEQIGSIGSSSTRDAYVPLASVFFGVQLIGSGITFVIPSISYQGTTFSSGVPDNNAIDLIDYYGWGNYSVPWSDICYVYGYGQ